MALELNQQQVQDIDDFLKTFKINNYLSQAQIDEIRRVAAGAAALGAGAMGRVIDIGDNSNVIKISALCEASPLPILQNLCTHARNGDIVFKIPYTPTNKTLMLAPNYITECIIGRLMSNVSPSFVNVKRFYFDKPELKVYTIMEKLSELTPKITEPKNYLYLMIQVMQALSSGQVNHKFVHNDLHIGNIMVRQYRDINDNVKCYELGNGKYLYTKFDYDNVITDYGLSRFESKEYLLIPREFIDREAADSYVFNEYTDILSFIYYLFTMLRTDLNNPARAPYLDILQKMFEFFFNTPTFNLKDPGITVPLDSYISGLPGPGWRASPKILYNSPVKRYSNATEMFQKVSMLLIKSYLQTNAPAPPAETDIPGVTAYINMNGFYLSDTQIYIDNEKFIPAVKHIKEPFYKHVLATTGRYRDEFIIFDIQYITNLNSPGVDDGNSIRRARAPFNQTLPQSILNGRNDFSVQHIFVAKINQTLGISKGYNFKLDCCKVDVRDYFKVTSLDSGIVINSVFFNIRSNMTPIGYYKTQNIIFDNPIPPQYADYYSFVGVNVDGTLEFAGYDERYNYDQVLACGPCFMYRWPCCI